MNKMTILCMMIATIIGIFTFNLKQKVSLLSTHLYQLNNKIALIKESQRIFIAEWNYLNEPSRLQRLAKKHLHINAGRGGTHFVMLKDLMNANHPIYGNKLNENKSIVQLASAIEKAVHEKPL